VRKLVAFFIVALATVPPAGAVRPPGVGTLVLVKVSPVTIAGSRFQSGERVKVTVAVDGRRRVRVVRANEKGAFRVVLAGVNADPESCNIYAGAVGSRRTMVKMMALECAVRIDPPIQK
jgi:hypothetical protein